MCFFKLKKYWLHFFFLIVLGVMLFFPSEEKKQYKGNLSTGNLVKIPGITDKREINVSFSFQGKNICGLKLYFYLEGSCESGTISYEVTGDGEKILTAGEWSTAMLSVENDKEIQALSMEFDEPAAIEEKLEIKLTGQEIDKNSVIGLYGNDQVSPDVTVESKIEYDNVSPLYQIESMGKALPYVWDILLLWLFASVIWLLKQKQGDEY